MSRVLRWEVLVDDRPHEIGGGQVIHVDCRPIRGVGAAGRVEVWTVEEVDGGWPNRRVQVYGTCQQVPDGSIPLGSALDGDGALVWHLFEVTP